MPRRRRRRIRTRERDPSRRSRDMGNDFGGDFGGAQNFSTVFIRLFPGARMVENDVEAIVTRLSTRYRHAMDTCLARDEQRQLVDYDPATELVPVDSLAYEYSRQMYLYRYERIAATTYRQTNQVSGAFVDLTDGQENTDLAGNTGVPNISAVLARNLEVFRQANGRGIPVYGTPGAEQWFERSITDVSPVSNEELLQTRLDSTWEQITVRTGALEGDEQFRDWPAGTEELSKRLVVRMNDMTLAQAETYTLDPGADPESPSPARSYACDWRQLREMASREADIKNPNLPVDYRAERKHVHEIEIAPKAGL